MYDLKNKNILITGGGSGLGFSLAKIFVGKGSKVTITGRTLEKLEKAKAELGNVEIVQCDVSNSDEIGERLSVICKDTDILINNAGVIQYGLLEEHTLENISELINTNLAGTIYMTNQCVKGMKDRKDGVIVNISSTSGLYGRKNETVYVASKWGVRGFSEGLKVELEGTNVDVFAIYPGGMNTDLFGEGHKPANPETFMNPDDVAAQIIDMIEKRDIMKMNSIEINRRK